MPHKFDIRTLIMKEGDSWVAQCLEYDVGAQAGDLDTLRTRLQAVLDAELEQSMAVHGKPFAGIEPAPAYFHNLWDGSTNKLEPVGGKSFQTDGKQVNLDYALCA